MTRTVLMTGAGGNIDSKLRAHFSTLTWTLRLLDIDARGDAEIQAVDLAEWNDAWVAQFVDVDTVPSRRRPEPGGVLGLGATAEHRSDCECLRGGCSERRTTRGVRQLQLGDGRTSPT